MKTLILVHGRSTKPRAAEKLRLVRQALLHGLDRQHPAAAERIRAGEVSLAFAYYGDISNRILVAADPELKGELELDPEDGTYYEPNGCYDEAMRTLLERSSDRFTRSDYRALVREHRDARFVDDIARVISPILAGGLSRRIITRYLPDLGAYITSRKVGSAIRQRLQAPMLQALASNHDVAVVSHSMGCIATYDVLWKFSHMSEYEPVHGHKVSLWLTLGSPLGEPSVQECLYDTNEPADGRYPRNVRRWVNVAAHDDFIAHDGSIADDFAEMRRLGTEVVDRERIYTFWVGASGSNPHKFYGYLDHPLVAAEIAAWIHAPEMPAASSEAASRLRFEFPIRGVAGAQATP